MSILRDDGPSAEALSSVQAVVSDSKSTIKDNDDESTDQIFQFRDPVSEQSLSSDNFQEESEVSPVSSVSPIRTPSQNITFRVQHSAIKDSDSLLTRLKKQYGIATIEWLIQEMRDIIEQRDTITIDLTWPWLFLLLFNNYILVHL